MVKWQKVLSIVVTCSSILNGDTVTLQQGVAGYVGCEDSYIESQYGFGYDGMGTNYGSEERLVAGCLRYLNS